MPKKKKKKVITIWSNFAQMQPYRTQAKHIGLYVSKIDSLRQSHKYIPTEGSSPLTTEWGSVGESAKMGVEYTNWQYTLNFEVFGS